MEPLQETEEQQNEGEASAADKDMNKAENVSSRAVVRMQEGCDVREELFYHLAKNRLPILELRITTRSLEEIFLELTASEKVSEEHSEPETEEEEDEMAEDTTTEEEEGGHAGDL